MGLHDCGVGTRTFVHLPFEVNEKNAASGTSESEPSGRQHANQGSTKIFLYQPYRMWHVVVKINPFLPNTSCHIQSSDLFVDVRHKDIRLSSWPLNDAGVANPINNIARLFLGARPSSLRPLRCRCHTWNSKASSRQADWKARFEWPTGGLLPMEVS